MINAEYQWIRVLGVENFENPANIGDSYGNISNLTPQTLEVSYSYALPLGRGRMLFANSNRMVDTVIGGWQIAGITSFQTGQPFSVTYTAPGTPVGLVSGRANAVPGVPLYPATNRPIRNGLTLQPLPRLRTSPTGTSGYNMLWGPHYQNWDMNLMKNITWKERYNLHIFAPTPSTSSTTPTSPCPAPLSAIPLRWEWFPQPWERPAL